MKKFCLITEIAVFLIFCLNGVQAQTMQTKLNQVELFKQWIGTWKSDNAKDTTAFWDAKSYGTGLEVNLKAVTQGKIVVEGKQDEHQQNDVEIEIMESRAGVPPDGGHGPAKHVGYDRYAQDTEILIEVAQIGVGVRHKGDVHFLAVDTDFGLLGQVESAQPLVERKEHIPPQPVAAGGRGEELVQRGQGRRDVPVEVVEETLQSVGLGKFGALAQQEVDGEEQQGDGGHGDQEFEVGRLRFEV